MTFLLFVCGLLMLVGGALFLMLPTGYAEGALTTAGQRPPIPEHSEVDKVWAWVIGVSLIGVGTFLVLVGLVL
jgi:hypothetical protein